MPTLRQAAVIALLAYCGSFVPARAAALGPLDAIHTRIGAADDLAGGRSTFMVEMTEAAAILHRATPQSLVLIDEIGRGTSTFDGLALAWAIAHQLAEKNRALALFATHYFELTALPAEIEGCANLHFDAVEHAEGIVYLHAAADGPANRSYGLQVAKLAGVPAEAIRRAKGYLARLDKFTDGQDQFAVCYADLDHFKEFNDRYSYYDGDRVIYILSRILHDVVKGLLGPLGFVGHIGGDDFIFVVPTGHMDAVCSEVLDVFDTLVPLQYSEQDRRAGYFFGKDRRGQLHRVPLMTLSIGIVTNRHRTFSHPAEVSELATEKKSYAKTLPGSVYVVDRRRARDAEGRGNGGRGAHPGRP